MHITLLAIGKRHNPDIALGIDDYTTRLQRWAKVQWQFVPPPKAALSPAEQRRIESDALRAALKADDTVVVLDERGNQWSSPQLATYIANTQQRSAQRLVIVIGGAHGVDDALRQRADTVWSLSKLVFPHQLVRLIVAEQLYRAFTILHGMAYHHDS